MRPALCAHLAFASTAIAFPLFSRRSPALLPQKRYNVVSVDGHDAPSPRDLDARAAEPEPKPASYSVVAVDGGPTDTAAPAPAETHTETLVTTRLSTIIITTAETPQTVVVTITESAPTQPAPTAADAGAPPPADATVTETVTASTPGPETTVKPYDNGQWHTTYYYTTIVDTPTPSPAPEPSASTAAGWHDVAPDLAGTQVVGGGTQEENADVDRQSWLQGAWAPWAEKADDAQGQANDDGASAS